MSQFNPSSAPQAQFFEAARTGSVSGMQEAWRAGALLTDVSGPEGLSAWRLIVRQAPLSSMKACFAFLKDKHVPFAPIGMGNHELKHALFELAIRKTPSQRAKGKALWRLWFSMEGKEQKRYIRADALRTYFFSKESRLSYVDYGDTLSSIWKGFFDQDTTFSSSAYRSLPHLLTLVSQASQHDSRVTPEALMVLIRSLSTVSALATADIEGEETRWGILCAMAPSFLLKECLQSPPLVTLLHTGIATSLTLFIQEGLHTSRPLQETCLLLIKRLHNAGLRWPDQWPEETREALRAFPDVRAWVDKHALEKTLPPSPSPTARRARV